MKLALPTSLISSNWLAANLEHAALRVLDCSVALVPAGTGVRPESCKNAWAQAHIPGSGYADLLADLSDRSSPFPMMMPPAQQFAAAMSAYGIGSDNAVVLYDSGPHTWATRLWWMLRAMGHDNAAVLDGGMKKWLIEGRPTSSQPCHYPPAQFEARPRSHTFVAKHEVLAAIDDKGVRLINALSADEHRGAVSRTARPGRIPGSGNVPAASLLDPTSGTFRPLSALREQFAAQEALDGRRVITYCGGGIAATSAAFTLIRLGVSEVGVYDGSLSEWSQDASLPMAIG
jgi:thiosulfate/3-mercaptopyruvate sulfurtransferase